jgi:CheY-like chemotaxis protein
MAHILVVDDELEIRELIKAALELDGHTTDLVENGWEAVERLKRGAYDLVIMDRNMPVMDGINALTNLRANAKNKALKVLMCTSASVNREIEEAYNAGANGYVLKPINLELLSAKVRKALQTP